jgi:hypothetical protein
MKLDLIKEQIVSITQHNKLKSKWHYKWVEPGKDTIFYGAITVNRWNTADGVNHTRSFDSVEAMESWRADHLYGMNLIKIK